MLLGNSRFLATSSEEMMKLDILPRIVALLAVLSLAAACNTIEGMGEDVESAGEAMEEEAEEAN